MATLPSICFITLGCAKNEVDTADMRARLVNAGCVIVDDPEQADAVIVNTCSFIQAATEESLDAIFEVSGLENFEHGNAKLIVAGCMPARYGESLTEELSEASSFVPCSKEDDIVEVVRALFPEFEPCAASDLELVAAEPQPSVYVKISDGCDRFCSYCTIPYIRGRYHSFPLSDIKAKVAAHIAAGTKEIVLIAQDTGRWGDDFAEPSTLAALIDDLARTFPDAWFRVMYVQPEGVTDELLETMAAHDNVCSYLDIPMQHVDADILRSMNRTGSREAHLALIARIREAVPGVTLRSTFIAGYPGETDEQFEELCDFIEEADLDYVGVFAYSQEEGTKAARLENQVDEDTKQQRAQTLRDIADSISTARVAERVGSVMDVLVLGSEEDGQLYGRAKCQAPDVDGVVYISDGKPGQVVSVTVDSTLLYEMEGA